MHSSLWLGDAIECSLPAESLRTKGREVERRRSSVHDVGDESCGRRGLREPQVAVAERVDDASIRGCGSDRRQRVGQRWTKAHPLGTALGSQSGHEAFGFREQCLPRARSSAVRRARRTRRRRPRARRRRAASPRSRGRRRSIGASSRTRPPAASCCSRARFRAGCDRRACAQVGATTRPPRRPHGARPDCARRAFAR